MIDTLYTPFKFWSKKGSVYVIGDLHLASSFPNWPSPEYILKKINSVVTPNDTLIVLGDIGKHEYIPRIAANYKICILGNHDQVNKCKSVFDEVYNGPLFIADKILLSHEPVFRLPFCVNIHGHVHIYDNRYASDLGDVNPCTDEFYRDITGAKHINIAGNICDFTPINLGGLIKKGALSDILTIHQMTIKERLINK